MGNGLFAEKLREFLVLGNFCRECDVIAQFGGGKSECTWFERLEAFSLWGREREAGIIHWGISGDRKQQQEYLEIKRTLLGELEELTVEADKAGCFMRTSGFGWRFTC